MQGNPVMSFQTVSHGQVGKQQCLLLGCGLLGFCIEHHWTIFRGGSHFNQSGHLGKSGCLFDPPWKMTGDREEFMSLKLLDVSGHAFLAICVTLQNGCHRCLVQTCQTNSNCQLWCSFTQLYSHVAIIATSNQRFPFSGTSAVSSMRFLQTASAITNLLRPWMTWSDIGSAPQNRNLIS